MSSMWGTTLKISLFGESHGPAIGVVIDGLPAGCPIDLEQAVAYCRRRAPGRTPWSTARQESDQAEILSGLYRDRTSGAPLAAIIRNRDTRSADYEELQRKPRPGHADLTARQRYDGYQDPRGSGHFSGRLTAPLTFAGAICSQILAQHGIRTAAHICQIGAVKDQLFNPLACDQKQLDALSGRDFPVLDTASGARMAEAVLEAASAGDSLGGAIEGAIFGLPAGMGDPMFDNLESQLASLLFGIPAVKGVSFGAGFSAAAMRGSAFNDTPAMSDGAITFLSNNSGGVIGGISTGQPLLFHVAVRPPASIGREQQTVDLLSGENAVLAVRGRHDPCIVPRAVPVVEAAAAIFSLDVLLGARRWSHD
ncbi:MAG: chorismate synthase [Clostridiaceae bacterium]|nr:chorismate synthase [Clostridiaceae bacterium]